MATSSSPINLSGRTYCVVTGASQGIGRAIAIAVSREFGPNSVMLLLARNKDELAITAEMCQSNNIKVICKSMDLSKSSPEMMQTVLKESLGTGSISEFDTYIIFHNVGSLGNLGVNTTEMEDVQEMRSYYDLNVFNVIALNTQFLKFLQGVEEDRIVIVNITSLCAIKPMSGMAYYCSGKAAREMYFRVLAEEKKNIKVLNYSPGPVETSMIDYVLSETVNDNLKDVFTSFKVQGVLLKPEVTAQKCVKVLKGHFEPGQHFDYFDDM